MNRRSMVMAATCWCWIVLMTVGYGVAGSDAQVFFASDKNGQDRVTNIQEGDEIWIVVVDPDENIDCDVRDKIWTDVKLMDPKTGAYIVWKSYVDEFGDRDGRTYDEVGHVPHKGHWPGNTAGWLGGDYLEETGADTSVFVSRRAFQVGTRESFSAAEPWKHTHVVDVPDGTETDDFRWGHYLYADFDGDGHADNRGWFGAGGSGSDPEFNLQLMLAPGEGPSYVPAPPSREAVGRGEYLIGRFENMDTLIGMYQDPDDAADVAIAMMKLIDTEATISWDKEVYKDANGAATITVVDPDENLSCTETEYVPVFVLVNPGSWNPLDLARFGPTNFCMLLRTGGVDPENGTANAMHTHADVFAVPIRWYNIYNAQSDDHRYYVQYNPYVFDTANGDGVTPVLFYAQETGTDTGVFQLNLNQILEDLEFDQLFARDVLVAYYLDPNDFDDFKLATAYIEERQHSITSFTAANRVEKKVFWIGRDPVYVQVIDANANVDPCCPEQVVVHICDPHGEDDAEWLILDETSANSPVFFTFAGMQLWPAWDALGVGLADSIGGWQLQLDNWKLEAFNEDDVYVRYNDVHYAPPPADLLQVHNDVSGGLATLGDLDPTTSFPPWIARPRVANDVSFALMSIGDNQVFDGVKTDMYFLDRRGNRVSGYANSDCVFIEVVDSDQDEDPYRRERIDGYWDGGQNIPFGPKPLNEFGCDGVRVETHPVNALLGDTNIFNDSPDPNLHIVPCDGEPKLYVVNPRSGHWAAVDVLETGVATGAFVSVICLDLVDVYECVPTLGVLPGDTLLAVYQDPSNHSDSAWISIKVGIGGGETPPTQQSTTMFVDAEGNEVSSYTDADLIYVLVTDLSHTQDVVLQGALVVDGVAYDLTTYGSQSHKFFSDAILLDLEPGDAITATYTDPTDPTDTSSDTITIVSSALEVIDFYAGPSPFEIDCTFGYSGTGIASVLSVRVYDLTGELVWSEELTDVTGIVWDGTAGAPCIPVANGAYIYTIYATDGTSRFTGSGKVFVNR